MNYKYLYEKEDKERAEINRKIFTTSEGLFEYLLKEGEKNFNCGSASAEIRLNRIEEIK